MRHGVKTKKLGRDREHRKAMLKNLATSILLKGLSENQMDRHIRTTVQKAKAVRSLVDRLITYSKKGDLTAKRQAARFVQDKKAFQGLFQTLAERYKNRNGGYTRVLKLLDYRHGDNAKMAIVTLVENDLPKAKGKKIAKKVLVDKKETIIKSIGSAEEVIVKEKASEAQIKKTADEK